MHHRESKSRLSFINSRSIFLVAVICSLAAVAWVKISADSSSPAVSAEELTRHIKYLASDELQGRRSGTSGNELAADYVAAQFKKYGLKAGNNGAFYQPFQFIAGVKFEDGNVFTASARDGAQKEARKIDLKLSEDYVPLNFSASGKADGAVVLAGFGISASKIDYDDYAKIDVKDKIVLALPYGPEGNNVHGKFVEYLALRRKALAARERGARAILFISEADTVSARGVRGDDNYSDSGIIALRIGKRAANELLKSTGKNVDELLKQSTEKGAGESVALQEVSASIGAKLTREMKGTKNVIGWVEGSDDKLKNEYIVIGAHYDHLGTGGSGSLAGNTQGIHYGADDNASGVAGLLELARIFSADRAQLKRSVVFMAFSGEEEGLLGSAHYVKEPLFPLDKTVGMINMDMIGRMRNDTLVVGGIGTSPQWKPLIEELNKTRGLSLKLQEDGFGPSDHASFYAKDLPVLFFFTGSHDDYHKPSDTADRVNVLGEQVIVTLVHDIASRIINLEERIAFSKAKGSGEQRAMNSSFRVYIGSVPDYAENIEGVKISGARPGSPAEKSGMQPGDVIVQVAGRTIKNVHDYTYVLQELKPNETIDVVVLRNGQKVDLKLTPTARQ